jgi:nucleotide-binding universal stress UspA family protein
MYKHILVAIENSESDRAVLGHIEPLARLTGARLLLVHVADGWAARHFDDLKLRESEEIRDDREYLARICDDLVQRGFETRARLAMGDPATELVKVAIEEFVDLIAMSTHGHRFLNDRPA